MNQIKTIGLLALLACLPSILNAQGIERLGLGVSTYDQSRLSFTASTINENNRALNFRISYGENFLNRDYDRRIIISADPSINNYLSERKLEDYTQRGRLAFGPEYQVNESKFSAGVEALLGLAKNQQTLSEFKIFEDENGFLEEFPALNSEVANATIVEKVERLFLSPGLQARLAFNTHVTGDVSLQLFVAASIEQDIQIDIASETILNENELSTSNISTLNLNTTFGFVLFYNR